MHIKGSINAPRGILEIVCDNDNKENATELINARNQEIAVICGSGKRSVMASSTMKKMGYTKSISLKTGLKGWNDYNLPLIDKNGNNINPDKVETYLNFDTKPTQFTHRK
jgi:rhodanese-related sulfurtransferase